MQENKKTVQMACPKPWGWTPDNKNFTVLGQTEGISEYGAYRDNLNTQ